MKTKLIALAVIAAATLIRSVARANDALARAEEACGDYRWLEALACFEVAGESGDRRAQQIAGLMHLYGDRMYPGTERSVGRGNAWFYRAEAQGSVEARYLLARLERNPSLDLARLVASLTDEPQAR